MFIFFRILKCYLLIRTLLEETPFPTDAANIFKLPSFKIPDNSQLTQNLSPQDTGFV